MTPLQKIEDHSKDILTSAAQRVLPAGAADAPGSPPGSVISEQTSGGEDPRAAIDRTKRVTSRVDLRESAGS